MKYLSINVRFVTIVLLLSAFSLVVTGFTLRSLHTQQKLEWIASHLQTEAASFRSLATNGTDPTTRKPFTNPDSLISSALAHTAFLNNESAFGIVNGKVSWIAPDGVKLRPEKDPALVQAALKLARKDVTSYRQLESSGHNYHFVVIPAIFDNSKERSALVRVIDNSMKSGEEVPYGMDYLVALAALLITGCFTWLAASRFLQPIAWVRETAEKITEHDLSQRIPVRGNDELAALTRTVNSMLDRLEQALDSNHQLLDDASHELRTPLTIVRGHIELMDSSDPEEVEATKTLVMSELDRMRQLVNDLLMLSRAERADFVAPAPTDIAMLTIAIFDKAQALGKRKWVLDEYAEGRVTADENRLQQAMLQLANNAVKYSQPESEIGIGSKIQGSVLKLWVRDEGIGITPADRELVLSRFGRTAAAKAHTSEGFGLGLVIVNSIATLHDGRLLIDANDPEPGVTVTISIPLKYADGSATNTVRKEADETDSDC